MGVQTPMGGDFSDREAAMGKAAEELWGRWKKREKDREVQDLKGQDVDKGFRVNILNLLKYT